MARKNLAQSKALRPARIPREELISRAEVALESMRDEFVEWIEEEIDDLTTALAEWCKTPTDPAAVSELFRRAHDLKGQATTLGYPIVGRIAASLCELLSINGLDWQEITSLTTSHVNAVRAAVRDEIRDETNQTAGALATELETAVSDIQASGAS
ncbi:MAG: hypothetical protein COA62_03545 [Rhodobiaceae bacterium]|nr:MAG: hypothetical protein COA62_03545 [Rhodobiaceae bacterium]